MKMNASDNRFLTVTKIYTVDKYVTRENDPPFMRYGNCFPTNELVFFLSGENETVVDGVSLRDCHDYFRFMPKGQTRGEYTVKRITPTACIDVYFDSTPKLSEHAFGAYNMGVLREKFAKLYETWTKKGNGWYSRSMMLLYDILYNIQIRDCDYVRAVEKHKVENAYNYICENFKERSFDYKSLCELCGLKHSQFNNAFKKAYSLTPEQLVAQMRTEYAKELIITTRYSMSEIAEMCGFDNRYYFSTVFKRVSGFAPSKYKID